MSRNGCDTVRNTRPSRRLASLPCALRPLPHSHPQPLAHRMGVRGLELWEILNRAAESKALAQLAVTHGFDENTHGTRSFPIGVDAVLTDDADTLLFGARMLLKNVSLRLTGNRACPARDSNGSPSRHHTMVYTADAIRNHPEVGLTRSGLIFIALLRGGDYHSLSPSPPALLSPSC
ncbi:hypothetical protein BV20DRAFT_745569 [Pilatotrama ljubarskyi]|nr:hypothetical protein BV20DRAFT_745569 [Pilatotrama ljubarskyi]